MDWENKIADLDEPQMMLVRHLAIVRSIRRSMGEHDFHYCGREDFLLQHGVWFPAQPWTHKGLEGLPKNCYCHAVALCRKRPKLRYVEGSAIMAEIPFPVDHAWNTDTAGNLIDGVWRNQGIAYLGVCFPGSMAREALLCGDTVLNGFHDRYALYRQPWQTNEDLLE